MGVLRERDLPECNEGFADFEDLLDFVVHADDGCFVHLFELDGLEEDFLAVGQVLVSPDAHCDDHLSLELVDDLLVAALLLLHVIALLLPVLHDELLRPLDLLVQVRVSVLHLPHLDHFESLFRALLQLLVRHFALPEDCRRLVGDAVPAEEQPTSRRSGRTVPGVWFLGSVLALSVN